MRIRYLAPTKFQHCATISPHRDGALIAFYGGGECTMEQAVRIYYWDKDNDYNDYSSYKILESLTGNPVFLSPNKLLVSQFENLPRKRIDWWKNCSLWTYPVEYDNGIIQLGAKSLLSGRDLLGRCTPITIDNKLILPLYDEVKGEGVIIFNDYESRISNKQGNIIQPTLWFDEETKKIHSLSRNWGRATPGQQRYAWYSETDDFGKSWSEPKPSSLYNANNSLVAVDNSTAHPLIIWNDDPNGRTRLSIGQWDGNGISDNRIVFGPGSYPNYCFDNDDDLHIVYTNHHRKIAHVIMSPEEYGKLYENTN